ncbi:MAG: tyrosine-type recombinase/integrase [[Clostridium] scindens]
MSASLLRGGNYYGESQKDLRGRSLRKGEVQRSSDKRYMYTYTDPMGRRKFIYANDLAELREKEAKLMKDQLDGLDLYVAGKASVNDTFDRYMSTKYNLRESTKSSYLYTYDHYVRDTFGKKRIADIKYSDVLQFYYYLLNEVKISLGTLDTVHCLLHPTFQLAVRDEIIRNNPTDGVMKEISRESGKNRGIRHALTVEQQRAFMEYIANHPIYYHWWPMFTVLLGTGCRIGEALGLRWQDLDYDKRTISINHSLSYYQKPESNKSVLRISKPKTEAGIRTIPMLDIVKDAFEMLYEEQLENGFNESEIDGMSGFIFCNRFGMVPNPQTVNHTIKRIANCYNADEVVRDKKERRDPIILPNFSCHHLRHTFCTRLCENETNLKVIQSIMGHRNIETTMDIYAEATEEKKQESFENLAAKLDIF